MLNGEPFKDFTYESNMIKYALYEITLTIIKEKLEKDKMRN